jgi:metal-responsive CopG/Arc/MetJ family transcriptional regulator
MVRTKFGVSIDDDTAAAIDEVASNCEDIDANRSDVIDAILTAFVEGNDEPTRRARELIIKKRKDTL